jgi:transposase
MDMRKTKAEQIVRDGEITRTEKGWLVPSQKGRKTYSVERSGEILTCTCPDFELRRLPCKHVLAVQIITLKWFDSKGRKILEVKRVSYPQNWTAYNTAQINEKDLFMKLLADLCENVEEEIIPLGRAGRHGLPRKDEVFASALKVYTTFSLRRFISDMRLAKERNFVSAVCSYSSVSNYMRDPKLTPILHELITLSAMPLRSVETKFAIDSSGLRTSKFTEYFVNKYNAQREHHWVKLHVCTGTQTNVITAVEVDAEEGNFEADSPAFIPLSKATYESGFQIKEMSADKAYLSRDNIAYIDSIGGVPYIPFKNNMVSKPKGKGYIWTKMYNFFLYNREEFLQHYHLRSNVESTFNMLKAKFIDLVRSKDKVAQVNETLLKVLCHNIVVLIHEMNELGIEPNFLGV